MYKCLECGNIFDEEQTANWQEPHGEDCSGCPLCYGAYEEAHQCIICNDYFLEDELCNDICDDCLEDYKYDFDMCYTIGAKDTESVEINRFLFFMFSKEEIEEVLFRELKEANKFSHIDCKNFIESDKFLFADRLKEEVC